MTFDRANASLIYYGVIIGIIVIVGLVRLIGPRPTIRLEGDAVILSSGFQTAIFTLGAYSKRVTIRPRLRVIEIDTRSWWAFKSHRRIEYSWVKEIIFSSGSSSSSGLEGGGGMGFFTVGLWLTNEESIPLFRFPGGGDYVSDSYWPDWTRMTDVILDNAIYGSTAYNVAGDSLTIADRLSAVIGVPVGNGPLY